MELKKAEPKNLGNTDEIDFDPHSCEDSEKESKRAFLYPISFLCSDMPEPSPRGKKSGGKTPRGSKHDKVELTGSNPGGLPLSGPMGLSINSMASPMGIPMPMAPPMAPMMPMMSPMGPMGLSINTMAIMGAPITPMGMEGSESEGDYETYPTMDTSMVPYVSSLLLTSF